MIYRAGLLPGRMQSQTSTVRGMSHRCMEPGGYISPSRAINRYDGFDHEGIRLYRADTPPAWSDRTWASDAPNLVPTWRQIADFFFRLPKRGSARAIDSGPAYSRRSGRLTRQEPG